ncbi:MAG: FAD:protein FMN transferase [Acidobacteria bacterium]|nr:FAD:protein FMN transferase [Acidobacteriota bacterium]
MSRRTAHKPAPVGTDWELWSTTGRLVVTEPDALEAARAIVDEETMAVELASSRFRDDSELAAFRGRAIEAAPISATLAALIRAALMAAELTDGAVDPTLGTAMDAIGYDRDIRLVLDDDGPVRAIASTRPGWRYLHLDGQLLTVPSGLVLDLGATAKAVAADRAAARVASELGVGALVSLGGDVATAGATPDGGWQVTVQDLPGDPSGQISVQGGTAIATSSTQRRSWRRGQAIVHHIIDPVTGTSAPSIWRSATVAGPSCLVANALSTAAIVWGARAPQRLTEHRLPARLVSADGSVIVLGGWPAEEGSTEWEVWR